ncbi:non-homologous end joining protein Ku [Halobacillus andaensis]|uniref:Non-homologous end joining protein Ku n=1 Tax=Halobacillus andaensis TaxID=1176239 RepID=A0A917B3T3_HALAA|nr:Ku protein [Halobacillus andaensis]MBP2004679.1 DNA end-binding protein Ku [Halobacillus andaensis]GGF19790.1 non-homologous end joining protein Ku [Halobacillus andaensis]
MHTMWKGTISFGLVNIPIKLHAATENKDIKLRQLHEECKSPIEYKKRCPVCDKEVANEEIVKAYEYTKNKFVVLDAEDLENLKKEQEDKSVEILDFVKLEEIDPIYFERSYFMSPNDGGTKAYGLLRQALSDTGKIGIAKIIIRSKEQLAIVRVYQNTLVMETIHFPDEVRNVADVPNVPEQTELSKKEVSTAITLIDQLTAEFEPEKYTDDYRTALMELIEAKRNNEEVTTSKPKSPQENVSNLMEALEQSLESTKESKKISPKRKTAAKKSTRKKKTS